MSIEPEKLYEKILPSIKADFGHIGVEADLEDATWNIVNILEDVLTPRTIITVEELDALDADSVLRTKHGTMYTKGRDRDVLLSGVGWFTTSDAIAEEQSFTVLYEPTA